MNFAAVDAIVNAVLYEGYVLYPYRPSSIKNRQRWTFGGIYPAGCSAAGASQMQTQCLVEGGPATRVEARVRFLQPVARRIAAFEPPLALLTDDAQALARPVESLNVGGRHHVAWDEAVEREVVWPALTLAELASAPPPLQFGFDAARDCEPLAGADGRIEGLLIRERAAIRGSVSWLAEAVAAGAWRLTLRIGNQTPAPATDAGIAAVQRRGFMSTHSVFGVDAGAFVSLIDPPPRWRDAAKMCQNQAAWPVLVGSQDARDTLLCSPIILYDHPQIAPQSAGDLFDGTEIDEILTLRILTMTDAEKAEMRASDERSRALLDRTEALTPGQLRQLHGVMRSPRADPTVLDSDAAVQRSFDGPRLAVLNQGGRSLRVGDRVRLCPGEHADIIDLALAGQAATIEAVEIDFEHRVHVAVTVDADPGRDLGQQRLPGHRFFFSPDEIEPLDAQAAHAGVQR